MSMLSSSISTLQRSATSRVLATASGWSGKAARISSSLLKKNSCGGEAHAVLLREARAGLDAEQHVVRRGVLLAQVVDVVGGHQLETGPRRQLGHARVDLGQLARCRSPASPGRRSLRRRCRPAAPPRRRRLAICPFSSAFESRPLGQPERQMRPSACSRRSRVVHARLVVVALEEGQAAQLEQVAVAGRRRGPAG